MPLNAIKIFKKNNMNLMHQIRVILTNELAFLNSALSNDIRSAMAFQINKSFFTFYANELSIKHELLNNDNSLICDILIKNYLRINNESTADAL